MSGSKATQPDRHRTRLLLSQLLSWHLWSCGCSRCGEKLVEFTSGRKNVKSKLTTRDHCYWCHIDWTASRSTRSYSFWCKGLDRRWLLWPMLLLALLRPEIVLICWISCTDTSISWLWWIAFQWIRPWFPRGWRGSVRKISKVYCIRQRIGQNVRCRMG